LVRYAPTSGDPPDPPPMLGFTKKTQLSGMLAMTFKGVEINPAGVRLIHDELAQRLLTLAITSSIPEGFARFNLRPSGLIDAINNFQV
jgi:hypothetical protein